MKLFVSSCSIFYLQGKCFRFIFSCVLLLGLPGILPENFFVEELLPSVHPLLSFLSYHLTIMIYSSLLSNFDFTALFFFLINFFVISPTPACSSTSLACVVVSLFFFQHVYFLMFFKLVN